MTYVDRPGPGLSDDLVVVELDADEPYLQRAVFGAIAGSHCERQGQLAATASLVAIDRQGRAREPIR